jgi:hypothetical protein
MFEVRDPKRHPQHPRYSLKQWFSLPKKLRRRWWRKTDFGRKPPSEALVKEIDLWLADHPEKELPSPPPLPPIKQDQDATQAWRDAHAAQRALHEAEDNKIMGNKGAANSRTQQ